VWSCLSVRAVPSRGRRCWCHTRPPPRRWATLMQPLNHTVDDGDGGRFRPSVVLAPYCYPLLFVKAPASRKRRPIESIEVKHWLEMITTHNYLVIFPAVNIRNHSELAK
jgi:hypothetical protein